MNSQLKAAFAKALIVLVPSYSVAFLTEKMVYVVPPLAAAGFFASSLDFDRKATTNRVDDDADDGPDDSLDIVDGD